ncbi:hypothetical protein JNJ66_02230 [Candidatus Saccharibacteria bacterium]|nr:hypothetical protein [Candidatus Saccharibacteria bacterium]
MADTIAQKRKTDARDLALLIYDMFIEQEHETDKIENGQNDANQTDDD